MLGPVAPLFQTFLWIVFFVGMLIVFKSQVDRLIRAIIRRVQGGDPLKLGPLEIGSDLKKLDSISVEKEGPESSMESDGPGAQSDWALARTKIYREQRGIFLTHLLFPSKTVGQKYDVFIYLIRHKTSDFSDVDYAEFFLGHMWGDKVFRESSADGMIGFRTSAYGPFLCTCKIFFKDKTSIYLSRYVDFEMERVFQQ